MAEIRIFNYIRCVRDANSEYPTSTPTPTITKTATPTLTPTPTPTITPILSAEVDIYSNNSTFIPGDTIRINVKVDNSNYDNVDMYAAIPLRGMFFWYPEWGNIPQPTLINSGIWDEVIANIPLSQESPVGTYTFYAAITDYDTINVLGIDSVTITIE